MASDTTTTNARETSGVTPHGTWGRWLTLAAALALGAYAYGPVVAGMVTTWATEENASHGFLVLPVCLYLAWRRRGQVKAIARPWAWGLVPLAAALLLLPLGVLVSVEFLPEVSFVAALGGLALSLWGPAALRLLAFPYAFMWFMVPWPDTLVEFVSFPMQLFSAKYAAMVTGLAGVPTSRDGVDIHLRNYSFSVGVPCSGMRSLVALLALSALVAYALSGPRWKRWLLFAAGLPLALLANVARIVCVLLIATFFGREAAEGFFHGFSGVAVFAFAALGLMLAGRAMGLGLVSAPAEPQPVGRPGGARAAPGPPANRVLAGAVALVAMAAGLTGAVQQAQRPGAPHRSDFSRVPMRLAQWKGQDLGPLDRTSQEMLHPDAFMGRVYIREDGYPVDLTVVVGRAKETFHSPGFCLLGGGWNINRKSRLGLALGGQRVEANEFRLQRADKRRVVLYWYVSHGEVTPSWVVFQYRLLRNRLLGRPSAGALVRITAPVAASDQAASEVAQELAAVLYGDLTRAMAL